MLIKRITLPSSGESVGDRQTSASRFREESSELPGGGIEGFLLVLRVAEVEEMAAVVYEIEEKILYGLFSQGGG